MRWLQDLLDTTTDSYRERYDPEREVFGLDVGVGASAIYPLLACSTRPAWRMVGTDVDQFSLEFAGGNVEGNGLGGRVRLVRTATGTDAKLIPLEMLGLEGLDFVMTNPPFYSSQAEMLASYGTKTAPPSAICTGSENEMICPGGDVGFVSRLLEESLQLQGRVQWYTAMLGKLSSLQQIVAKLKERKINNFAVTCLQAGHKTKRWAVAWSFGGLRPRNDVARHGELVFAVLPPPNAQTISLPVMMGEMAGGRVDAAFRDLDVRWQWRAAIGTGVMEAKGNTWGRAARRRKKFGREAAEDGNGKGADESEDEDEDEDPVAIAVKVVCKKEEVEVRWLRGLDHIMFQSLCGFLKRALTGQA